MKSNTMKTNRPWIAAPGITRPMSDNWKLPDYQLFLEKNPDKRDQIITYLTKRGMKWTASRL